MKIGRKYITVDLGYTEKQFHINSGREKSDYSPSYWVWHSPQMFKEAEEANVLRLELRRTITAKLNGGSLTLAQMRQIKAIIDEAE